MEFLSDLGRGALGMASLLFIAWLFSNDRRHINWRLVGMGIGMQLVLAVAILEVPFVRNIFDAIAHFFVVILDFTEAGASFLFGSWPDVAQLENGITGEAHTIGFIFAFKVLPTIVFFSAISAVLYYLGILQLIIKGFAWVMTRSMKLTGAESLAAAANVFIGQTEAPLVIRPYLEGMSRSEIMCLMTGGMATIAGSVFAAYVGFLGGDDPVQRQLFATHLLTASIISAPAAIVAAKMLYPERRDVRIADQKLDIPREEAGNNLLDAISRGTTDGLRLAVNVGVMLLVFLAFVAMLNYFLKDMIGEWTGLNEVVVEATSGRFEGFNLQYLLGLLFAPFAWLLGTPTKDVLLMGQLLGIKTTLNEFIAYAQLHELKDQLSPKSVIIATYALCGFANFGSIGIQIGGIGALAPNQRQALTELGVKALIGGTIAAFMTAVIAGVLA